MATVAGFATYYGWLPNPLHTSAAGGDVEMSAADTADEGKFRILGWLEPADGLIDINGIPGDRLEKLLVAEDGVVSKGQPLAHMADRTLKATSTRCRPDPVARGCRPPRGRDPACPGTDSNRETRYRESQTAGTGGREPAKKNQPAERQPGPGPERLRPHDETCGPSSVSRPCPTRWSPSRNWIASSWSLTSAPRPSLAAAKADLKRFAATQRLAAKAAEADSEGRHGLEDRSPRRFPSNRSKKHGNGPSRTVDLATDRVPLQRAGC